MEELEVFHQGERTVQRLTGQTPMANLNGRMISDQMANGPRAFVERQTVVFVSCQEANGQVWASVLTGPDGFIQTPSAHEISIGLTPSTPLPQPVLEAEAGFEIGLLFLELSTRRRFRASGTVIRQQDRLHIRLAEAYPNCPKYIQRRLPKSVDHIVGAAKDWESGLALSPAGKSIIEQADTFFVGSVSAAGRMDASHRGGPVGFVEITPGGVLKVPDYQGNGLFNTLGNIVEDPRAGLLFIDFETGALLQLSGEASLLFNQESDEDVIKTTGTGRYWTFKISGWRMLRSQASLQMEYLDASPFNPQLA